MVGEQLPQRAARALVCALVGLVGASGLARAQDQDGDGVSDAADGFPCDAGQSGVVFAPSQTARGTLLFEDNWPHRGDLDFNDVVLGYHYEARTNPQGVVQLFATYDVRALGLVYDPGIAVQLPVPAAAVAGVQRRVDGGSWEPGLQLEDGSQAVLVVDRAALGLFGDAAAGGYVSTEADRPRMNPVRIELRIDFGSAVSLDMGRAPFDVFIFRSGDYGHQIHRPHYAGTPSMNTLAFGTGDDGSSPGRWFVDRGGLPFVLDVPGDAVYPVERVALSNLYPSITTFAASGGTQATDYYQTPNMSHAYADGAGASAAPVAAVPSRPADLSCVLTPWPANLRVSRSGGCFWSFGRRTYGFSFSGSGITGNERWFRVEYAQRTTLTAMRINAWNGTYRRGGIRHFRVEASDDASSWTTVTTGTHPSASGWHTYRFPGPVTARYFRLVIWGSYMAFGTSCGHGQIQGSVEFYNP